MYFTICLLKNSNLSILIKLNSIKLDYNVDKLVKKHFITSFKIHTKFNPNTSSEILYLNDASCMIYTNRWWRGSCASVLMFNLFTLMLDILHLKCVYESVKKRIPNAIWKSQNDKNQTSQPTGR